MFKKGFTVSELVICLAIIGVIAAMLIPQIVNKRPNKEKAMFRKAYYIAERVVIELINNDDLYPSDLDARQGFAYYDTENGETNNTGVQFCQEFSKKVNTAGDVSCSTAHILTSTSTTPTFTTNDGVDWYFVSNKFCDPDYDTGCTYPASSNPTCPTSASDIKPYTCIYMDVNGTDNLPNTFSAGSTTDRFKLYVYYNGKIQIDSTSPAVDYLKSKTIF